MKYTKYKFPYGDSWLKYYPEIHDKIKPTKEEIKELWDNKLDDFLKTLNEEP